jgi:hypothetical protein
MSSKPAVHTYRGGYLVVAVVLSLLLRVRTARSIRRGAWLLDAFAFETYCFCHMVVPPFFRGMRLKPCQLASRAPVRRWRLSNALLAYAPQMSQP